jgi:hypothetical protein
VSDTVSPGAGESGAIAMVTSLLDPARFACACTTEFNDTIAKKKAITAIVRVTILILLLMSHC